MTWSITLVYSENRVQSNQMNWWTLWDFPAWSVYKKMRYCCFSHGAPVATDGPGSVHETPLSPPRVCGFPPPALCCSVWAVSSNGRVWERVYSIRSRLPVCTHPYECVCSWVLVFFGAGSTVVHMCALRQCGALWFPVPQLLIFFFLLSFVLLYSLFHSLPLPLSPYIGPPLFIQLNMSG